MPIRAALLPLALLAPAAAAAEVTFPPGSRIGIEPPKDMGLSKRFTGFERPEGGAVITFVELPGQASADLKSMSPETLRAQGFDVKTREDVKLASGADAVLFSGEQNAGGTEVQRWILVAPGGDVTALVIGQSLAEPKRDADMRAALLSVAFRAPLGIEEQVAALPFRLADRAGFRPVRVLAGNSVLLTDGDKDQFPNPEQPMLIVARSPEPPPAGNEQREALARAALFSNAAMKDFRIERSQPFRQRGAEWHEIVARATDAATGAPMVVAQTLRFSAGSYLRVVGITHEDKRGDVLPRFRAVADGLGTE